VGIAGSGHFPLDFRGLTPTPVTRVPVQAGCNARQAVGVDDWNGDGSNDLLMWHPASGWLDFWFMRGVDRQGSAVPTSSDPGTAWKPPRDLLEGL